MRILVTGATGFAGRWLSRELERAGHVAVAAPPHEELDITDAGAVAAFAAAANPDAIAHLAGLAFGPDARRAPEVAMAVNAGGTEAVLLAGGSISPRLPVLVVSSAEVYGAPQSDELPLSESAPLRATQPYGRSKVAAEAVAVDAASRGDRRIAIARPFNHAGPGQRLEFVVPALARRVIAARAAGRTTIVAGNIDVRRDFVDVRDVVRAYRLILEALADGRIGVGAPFVANIATGRSVAIRDIAERFGAMAGLNLEIAVDPALVRADDPPDIRGDASRVAADVGWSPTIPFEVTLTDVFEDVRARAAAER